jgi:hypothetical protein
LGILYESTTEKTMTNAAYEIISRTHNGSKYSRKGAERVREGDTVETFAYRVFRAFNGFGTPERITVTWEGENVTLQYTDVIEHTTAWGVKVMQANKGELAHCARQLGLYCMGSGYADGSTAWCGFYEDMDEEGAETLKRALHNAGIGWVEVVCELFEA